MDRSPERISSLCSEAAATDCVTRPSANRTRAWTSAGPALHVAGPAEPARPLAVVVAHGFTGSIDKPAVRAVVDALAKHAGVVAFDFRGHGRSSGHSTLGDKEILDLDAAVRHARELGYA